MKQNVIKIILCLLSTITLAHAQDGIQFQFENDFFAPGGEDKWLTNNMRLEYNQPCESYAIGSEMYTPKNKRNEEIPLGDRPWDGYSYAEYKYSVLCKENEFQNFTFRLGTLGRWSGAPAIQKWFHDDVGFGSHPTWAYVNESELAAEFIYNHIHTQHMDTWFGSTQLLTDYGIRLGNVKLSAWLDQELRRGVFGIAILSNQADFFLFSGVRGEGVAYNTFLDGRMFSDNVYTVESVPFVAAARIGIGMKIAEFILAYEYIYLTEEFEGQNGRHLRGRFTLGYEW